MPALVINRFGSIDYNNLIAASVITSVATFVKCSGQKEPKMGSNVPDKEHGKLAWKLFQISIKRAVDLKLPWVEFFYSSN